MEDKSIVVFENTIIDDEWDVEVQQRLSQPEKISWFKGIWFWIFK